MTQPNVGNLFPLSELIEETQGDVPKQLLVQMLGQVLDSTWGAPGKRARTGAVGRTGR